MPAAIAMPEGVREARRILRSGNPTVILGSLGYWAFDNAVLWACFKALGYHVPLVVLLLGHLIWQLGGILPLPGGVGGVILAAPAFVGLRSRLNRPDRPPTGVPIRARCATCRWTVPCAIPCGSSSSWSP